MTPRRSLRLLVAVVVGVAFSLPGSPLPSLVQETRLLVDLDVLPAAAGETAVPPLARRSIEIVPGRSSSETLDLAWPDASSRTLLRIDLSGSPGPEGGEHEVAITARLDLPGGRAVQTSRDLRVRDGATQIVDLFAEKGRRILLAVRAERTTRPVVAGRPRAGAQVRFRLEVGQVEGERETPLESNVMDTFLGNGVEYSFRRGEGDALESMRVLLTPLRIDGEIAELQIEVTGTLPGSPTRVVVSRRERMITTRGATSRMTVLSGAGPSGYRFSVTPDF